jgi:transposase
MPNYPQVQGHPHNEHHSEAGGQRAACLYSIIESCKMNGVEPQAYLTDVLARIADHPIQKINDLLPWHWKK